MAYEVKFGFAPGYNLVFAAFQPNGTGRGMANQPLYEVVPTGYYRAEPATVLEDSDVVLAYNLETVYWEDDIVLYLTYENVFYEGEQIYYEGDWVRDLDTTSNDIVTWTGDVVGSGEYKPEVNIIEVTADLTSIETKVDVVDINVDTLLVEAKRTNEEYDETTKPITLTVIKNI